MLPSAAIVRSPDKVAKKTGRKQTKALQLLAKDYQIEESSEPGQNVLVCNAGLVTGCSQADLLAVFSKFGPVRQLVLIPKKSYSFVVFSSTQDAQAALESVNGKVGFSDKGPIYLAFVNGVPEPELTERSHYSPPPGALLVPDFVSEAEAAELLELLHFSSSEDGQEMKHRQVKHFGYEFDYKINNIDSKKPLDVEIPSECMQLVDRMLEQNLISERADQLTVNLYRPGQGIPLHTDTHNCCTDWVASVSLGAGILMDFKGPDGETRQLWLPARSLLLLKEESRYCWRHGITPRHNDIVPDTSLLEAAAPRGGLTLVNRGLRMSLTFRKTMIGQCACDYPRHCNRPRSTPSSSILSMLEESASHLESKLVHQVYEEIAEHFSDTRHKPWPRVVEFIQSVPAGRVLVDLGCGNGKYLGLDPVIPRYEIGGDFSINLLRILASRGLQSVRLDLLNVPLRDGVAGGVLCIAALHHLATEARRIEALTEMCRILERSGRLLIYVWARDQKKENLSSYLKQNKLNFQPEGGEEDAELEQVGEFGLPVHVNRTQFQHQDVLVPWKLRGENERVYQRYYHVFQEGELEQLLAKVEGLRLLHSYYDQGNWCIIAEKI